jgi:hypothetical protein
LIVELEHLLFSGVTVVVLSSIGLLISSMIQVGYADLVLSAFQGPMSILAAIPWRVFLATLIVGVVFLWLAGKGSKAGPPSHLGGGLLLV